MTREPNIPDVFDVYTVVVLRRPDPLPELADSELDELQARHLEYRAELTRQGVLVTNGPFGEQSDATYRGMSIFACSPGVAARLSAADPSVLAGRLTYDVMEWWVAAGSIAFPQARTEVGTQRMLPD